MTEQLKPCPFCGGINVIHSGYRMYCHACGAEGPDADSADESAAIAAWNRRDQPTQAGVEPVAWIPLEDWRWNNTDGIWEGLAANLHPPARTGAEPLNDDARIGWCMWRIKDLEQQLAAAHNPPPARVPLTDEQIIEVAKNPMTTPCSPWWLKDDVVLGDVRNAALVFARAIERAHGIGGGK